MSVSALLIVHVPVDHYKLVSQGSEYVKNAPLFFVDLIKVYLAHYLIDVLKFFDWEVLKSLELAALTVYFKEKMFILKIVSLDNIFQSIEGVLRTFLSYRA